MGLGLFESQGELRVWLLLGFVSLSVGIRQEQPARLFTQDCSHGSVRMMGELHREGYELPLGFPEALQ